MSITDSAPVPPPSGGFDSGAAAFHAFSHARREGWAPLVKLGVVYFVANLAAVALLLAAMWPFFSIMFDFALWNADNPKLATQDELPPGFWGALSFFLGAYTLFFVFYLVFYSVIDAALLRWLLGRGARPRLGGDELRLMLLSLLWVLVLPLVVFAPFWALLIAAVAAGAASAALGWSLGALAVLAFIGGMVAWFWLAVRLAPAAALTVRDSRLRIFESWAATRGVFWPLLGAFVIVSAVYMGVALGMQLLVQPFMLLAGGEIFTLGASMDPAMQPDVSEILAALFSPAMIAIYAVSGIVSIFVYFAFQALLAGVNVYLLKTRRT